MRNVGRGMTRLSTITWGPEKFRVGPWHADGRVAYLAVGSHTFRPSPTGIGAVLERLRRDGFARVVTGALRPQEVPAFLASGFAERERLVVLSRPIHRDEPSPTIAVRRCRPTEMDQVVRVDHAAFAPPWQLDVAGIRDAMAATPRSRLRLVTSPALGGAVAGYAVCGRAGRTGYLQRLAVDPTVHGHGLGRALLADALGWLARWRATEVLVNTQETNRRAIDVYLSAGFRADRSELIVLERDL